MPLPVSVGSEVARASRTSASARWTSATATVIVTLRDCARESASASEIRCPVNSVSRGRETFAGAAGDCGSALAGASVEVTAPTAAAASIERDVRLASSMS
jgi:hypothetical protein